MAFYAFMTEAPPPRTVFSATPQIDEAAAEEARVFEEKPRAVLVSFPEATAVQISPRVGLDRLKTLGKTIPDRAL